jgi:predicted XRE-type DNA-binding protein
MATEVLNRALLQQVEAKSKKANTNTEVDDSSIQWSSGNVFEDIGMNLPKEEALKIDLAVGINQKLSELGKTQLERSMVLGVDQGTISNIERYALERYSVGRLVRYAGSLGFKISILDSATTESKSPKQVKIKS